MRCRLGHPHLLMHFGEPASNLVLPGNVASTRPCDELPLNAMGAAVAGVVRCDAGHLNVTSAMQPFLPKIFEVDYHEIFITLIEIL